MANNNLPTPVAELLDIGEHCMNGLSTQGPALGILQYTSVGYGAFVINLRNRQLAFNAARSNLAAAYVPYHAAETAMRKGGMDARKVISISLGDDWSPAWVAAGWPDHTTAVPESFAGLQILCAALRTFLTNQVDYQVETSKVIVTPLRYEDLGVQGAGAAAGLTMQETALGVARDARKVDDKKLRAQTRGLIDLLSTILDPNSPLWDAFGLNRPGASVTPGQPSAPALTKVVGGKVLAQTVAVPTATYYRWFSQLVGVDPEFHFLGRSQDPLLEIGDLPAAGTLKVKLQAANEAGPGKASAVSTIVLGA